MKAFAHFKFDRDKRVFEIENRYNIKSIEPSSVGTYMIRFANELFTQPVISLSFFDIPEESTWGVVGSFRELAKSYVIIDIFDLNTKLNVDNSFCLTVF